MGAPYIGVRKRRGAVLQPDSPRIDTGRGAVPVFALTANHTITDALGISKIAAHSTERVQLTRYGNARRYFNSGFTNQGTTVTGFPSGVMGARGWTIGVRGVWNGGGAGVTPGLVSDSSAGAILRQTATGVLSFFIASATRITSTYALASGEEFYALLYGVSGNYALDVNGTIDTSSAAAGNFSNVGYVGSRAGATFDGALNVYVWDGILPKAEQDAWIANPFCVFTARKRQIFLGTTTTVYTLTADAGSFTHSGQDATLLKHSVLSADYGAFTLSGQAASLNLNRILSADHGAFALAGQDAALSLSKVLAADAGTFTLTGQDATLLKHSVLTADAGTFTLAGQAAALLKSHVLTADNGAFTLTGQDATLTYTPVGSYTLTADAGSFVLTGQDATVLYNRLLSASHGAFTLSGQDAALTRALTLAAEFGEFALNGQAVALRLDRVLTAEHGVFLLTGQAATLTYSAQGDVFVRVVSLSDFAANSVILSDGRAYSVSLFDGIAGA